MSEKVLGRGPWVEMKAFLENEDAYLVNLRDKQLIPLFVPVNVVGVNVITVRVIVIPLK